VHNDGETYIKVKKVKVHPNFDVGIQNDSNIALLELEVSTTFTDKVGAACLPKQSAPSETYEGRSLLVR
jgi:hypothetical protein